MKRKIFHNTEVMLHAGMYTCNYVLSLQHCAVASTGSKRRGIVEALLRKGAPLQEKNKEFLTPLHVCADKGHCDIMELLLKHGSKVNALDGLGQTGEASLLCVW